MKQIITSIKARNIDVEGSELITLDIIPASGTIKIETSIDGLTEIISLEQPLRRSGARPEILTKNLEITIDYENPEAGSSETIMLGSAEIPARLQVSDSDTRTVSCTYKRAI